MYCSIEQIKNGLFTVTKYEGDMFFGPAPHVFIFANTLPQMNPLSKDRWAIHRIGHISKKLNLCNKEEIDAFIMDRIREEEFYSIGGEEYF